ncbi:hypothetical protein [Mucilaginibacter antarcticus]|uniref:hypothetical protein n=1 Tax=Mucilaginibacter antarcticus TaxID=1855725 RepID=UPI00362B932C
MQSHLFTFMLILGSAQSGTDTAAKQSPVRTLTYEQYQSFLKGEAGADLARVAELNHYPMPDKVLKYKAELDLSPIQVKKLRRPTTICAVGDCKLAARLSTPKRSWIVFLSITKCKTAT